MKKSVFLFLFLCIVIAAIEISAYIFGGIYAIIASRLWIAMGIIFLFFSQYVIFRAIIADIKKKFFLGLLSLLYITLLTIVPIGSSMLAPLHHEATQQVSAALENIKQADLNYTKPSFLGYPSRQYLIAALPTILFGRSKINLQLGYALPFLLGVFLLYAGLRNFLKEHFYGNYLSAFVIISIISFPYVIEFLRRYEQAILPISFTMQTLGWMLLTIKKQTIRNALSLIWAGSMLATSYTPGLSSWALLLTFIVIFIIHSCIKRSAMPAIFWICCFMVILAFGLSSFQGREDGLQKVDTGYLLNTNMQNAFEGYSIFFFADKKLFLNPLLLLPIMIYIACSLLWFNKLPHFLISFWVLLTIAFSVYLKGYASPPPILAIHRAMVIIPPLMTGLVVASVDFISKNNIKLRKGFFHILFILIIISSLWHFNQINHTVLPTPNAAYLTEDIVKQTKVLGVSTKQPVNIAIFSTNNDFISINDFLMYFFPKYNLLQDANSCLNNFDYSNDGIIYFDQTTCSQEIRDNKNFNRVGYFEKSQIAGNDNTIMTKALYKTRN